MESEESPLNTSISLVHICTSLRIIPVILYLPCKTALKLRYHNPLIVWRATNQPRRSSIPSPPASLTRLRFPPPPSKEEKQHARSTFAFQSSPKLVKSAHRPSGRNFYRVNNRNPADTDARLDAGQRGKGWAT